MDRRHIRRVRRLDRIARWAITLGGISVIACVLTMLVLIVWTALPLFRPARVENESCCPLPTGVGERILAAGADDYRETGFVLDDHGVFTFLDLRTGEALDQVPARPAQSGETRLAAAADDGNLCLSLLWADGSASLVRVRFIPEYEGDTRTITHRVQRLASFPPVPGPVPLAAALRAGEEGALEVLLLDRSRFVVRRAAFASEDDADEAAMELGETALLDDLPEPVTAFALDRVGAALYAGTERGTLLRWDLTGDVPRLADRAKAFADHRPVTALGLVFGDVSLVVGDALGTVSTWTPVALYGAGTERHLARIHSLSRHDRAVEGFLFTRHDKSVISLGAGGTIHLDHMTSRRHLLALRPEVPTAPLHVTLRGDGLLGVGADRRVRVWRLHNPHPEVSWRVLFGKVWYEGYDHPAFVWQSSSANDDSEAKFSLVPLIFGSLKGTFYALLFAVPVALFGALYTSQFATPETRGIVKPMVEVMAAIPSVVVGFLAALWLAPLIERFIMAVFLYALALPAALVVFLVLWGRLRRLRALRRLERGGEFVLVMPVLALAALAAAWGAPLVERAFFEGDFKLWLFHEGGIRFDPRNSIVIAFALGFAVIPIVFTVAEDALSNVPESLKAASLALGASRWQTVWRVVLPSASPGVFAGIIIGFGRAVGETMIVLMATGNTPVLDWGLFSGMRTLSANIAVEIPEAPAGGTLYRILFLSAALLFLLTSVLNTAAELIRSRLRKRFGY